MNSINRAVANNANIANAVESNRFENPSQDPKIALLDPMAAATFAQQSSLDDLADAARSANDAAKQAEQDAIEQEKTINIAKAVFQGVMSIVESLISTFAPKNDTGWQAAKAGVKAGGGIIGGIAFAEADKTTANTKQAAAVARRAADSVSSDARSQEAQLQRLLDQAASISAEMNRVIN